MPPSPQLFRALIPSDGTRAAVRKGRIPQSGTSMSKNRPAVIKNAGANPQGRVRLMFNKITQVLGLRQVLFLGGLQPLKEFCGCGSWGGCPRLAWGAPLALGERDGFQAP